MSKPEYGTIEYLKEHQGEWWKDQEGQKHYVVGIGENGWVVHQYFDKEGNRQTATCSLDMFFVDNIRPESDPAPVKRKVELPEYWMIFTCLGDFVDLVWGKDNADEHQAGYIVRHIPATTIEVDQ